MLNMLNIKNIIHYNIILRCYFLYHLFISLIILYIDNILRYVKV